jgi:hypothetical protein
MFKCAGKKHSKLLRRLEDAKKTRTSLRARTVRSTPKDTHDAPSPSRVRKTHIETSTR